MEVGTRIWITDAKEGWALATVVRKSGNSVVAQIKGSGEEITKLATECFSTLGSEPGLLRHISDLTKLPALHEAALLQALHERYDKDEIYTSVGPILIALNPFKKIGGLYENSARWINRQKDLPPHVYGLADASFRSMVDNAGCNQSILVSGESGAGKTETTKHAMQYLTEVSGGTGAEVSSKILAANPLLEAFGNAKTVRNDNSSRFGKLIEMKFADSGRHKLTGAGVTSYLLEKARVVHQAKGERNYHIFYEIFAGCSMDQLFRLGLRNPEDHNYLSSSEEFKRADVEDEEQHKKTMAAMTTMGFTREDAEQLFRVVAGILHLGDIEFEERSGGEACAIANEEPLRKAADMLGIDAGQSTNKSMQQPERTLADVLCVRKITVQGAGDAPGQGETYVKPLNVQFAREARDALAMAIYERLFSWIVWRVNHSMEWDGAQLEGGSALAKGAEKMRFQHRIGVLDIFGFEVFEENFFEQLCINYANEQLQRQFNEHVFELEQKMYESEGVDWTFVAFPDNSPTIAMIESKPIGLLSLIDEECMYPSGGDKSLSSKLYQNLNGKSDRFSAPHTQQRDMLFTVRHFAGDVVYTIEGFYRKNKNELRQDAVDLICGSNSFLTRVLLPPDAQEAAGGADAATYFDKRARQLGSGVLASPGSQAAKEWGTKPLPVMEKAYAETAGHGRAKSSAGRRSQLQQTTVSSHFKSQLHSALSLIRASRPHYVRCLKPNDKNRPNIFFRPRVLSQLRYSGVVEVIKVARAGYPTRFDVPSFVERYATLICLPSSTKGGNNAGLREARRVLASQDEKLIKQCAESICLSSMLTKNSDFQVGKTRVFLRADAMGRLEDAKNAKLKGAVRAIQRAWRHYITTHRKSRAVTKIQRRFRGFIARKKVKRTLVRRRAAADLIHSDIHFLRWVEEVRLRLRSKYELDAKAYDENLSGTSPVEIRLLWWYVVPLALIAGVPRFVRRVYKSNPHVLLLALLCLTGLAFGSVLILDAQRRGLFPKGVSAAERRRRSSAQAMEKKRRKASAILFDDDGNVRNRRKSSVASTTMSVASRKASSSAASTSRSPYLTGRRFGGIAPPAPVVSKQPVQIMVNADAVKRFAGLATRRKEAMDRAKRKAEDMLRTGELQSAMTTKRGSGLFQKVTTIPAREESSATTALASYESHSTSSSGGESPKHGEPMPFVLGRRASGAAGSQHAAFLGPSNSSLGQSQVAKSSSTKAMISNGSFSQATTSSMSQTGKLSLDQSSPTPKTSSLGPSTISQVKTSSLGVKAPITPTPLQEVSSKPVSKTQELLRRSSNPVVPVLPPNKPRQPVQDPVSRVKHEEKPRAETGLDEDEQYMLNKAILSMFLEEQAPEQLDMADDLLNEFKGREETLFDKLTEEFPEVDALKQAGSTDTPAWDKFTQKRKQRQSHRGFFGTASPSLGLDEDVRVVQEKTSAGSKKNRFSISTKKTSTLPDTHSTTKKKSETGARSFLSKFTGGGS